jgi:hypothetical protein
MRRIKYIILATLFVAGITGTASAISPKIKKYVEATTYSPAQVDAAIALAVETAVTAIVDTNSTTVTTVYTPSYVGKVLVGAIDGTTTVWSATGETTNDWSQIN